MRTGLFIPAITLHHSVSTDCGTWSQAPFTYYSISTISLGGSAAMTPYFTVDETKI